MANILHIKVVATNARPKCPIRPSGAIPPAKDRPVHPQHRHQHGCLGHRYPAPDIIQHPTSSRLHRPSRPEPPHGITTSRHHHLPAEPPHGTKTPPQYSTTSPLLRRPEHVPSPIRCLLHLSAACCLHDQSDGGCNAYSKTICIKTFGKTIAYSPPNGHIARHQM